MNTNVDWIGLSLGYAGQTVFLTVALWIMLKLQTLPRNILGVIGCAALACLLDHIPYVGIEVSFVVLLVCVTKLIRSRTFTDAIFTVGIAYAITFAFNMFVITALMGDLRPSARVRARTAERILSAQSAAATNQPAPGETAAASPPSTPALAVEKPATPAATAASAPQPLPAPSTTPPSIASPAQPVVDTNQVNAARMAGDIYKHYFIRGVSEGATVSIAMISNGKRNMDIAQGESFQLETSTGDLAEVKCLSVSEGRVVITVNGFRVTLLQR